MCCCPTLQRCERREAIQHLQEGQAQLQAELAEIMEQLQKLQPHPRSHLQQEGQQPLPLPLQHRPPSLEVTLALMQQDLSDIKNNIKKLGSDIKDDIKKMGSDIKDDIKKLDSKIQALDNKVVVLMVAVSVLGTQSVLTGCCPRFAAE